MPILQMQVSSHLPSGTIDPTAEFQLFGSVSLPTGSLTRVNIKARDTGTTGTLTNTVANIRTALDKRQKVAAFLNASDPTVVTLTVDNSGNVTDFDSFEGTLTPALASHSVPAPLELSV